MESNFSFCPCRDTADFTAITIDHVRNDDALFQVCGIISASRSRNAESGESRQTKVDSSFVQCERRCIIHLDGRCGVLFAEKNQERQMRRWTFIASLAIMERDVPLPFAHLPRIRTNFTWFLPILETAFHGAKQSFLSIFFSLSLSFSPSSIPLRPRFLANLNFAKKEAPFCLGISFRHEVNESTHCDCVIILHSLRLSMTVLWNS